LNAHSRLVKKIARFRFSTELLDQKLVRIRTATDQNEVHFDKVAVAIQGQMKRWPMLVGPVARPFTVDSAISSILAVCVKRANVERNRS
jgi:hypothetical protein